MKFAVLGPALLLVGAVGSSVFGAQDAVAPFTVPADLMGKTNPVKPTPDGLAHAKKVYGYDCAICHGASGDGKGDIASSLKTPMKDFSDLSVQGKSDGELFYIIQKGKGEMPSEGDRGKDADIWNMVSYLRTFKK
jgi:mono/diheme cytochrome c family protein